MTSQCTVGEVDRSPWSQQVEHIFVASDDTDEVEEVLRLARILRGVQPVTVVAPEHSDLEQTASNEGFPTIAVAGTTRTRYVANLRCWSAKARNGRLWCRGIGPAVATLGHRRRVIQLPQPPKRADLARLRAARVGAQAILVPTSGQRDRIKDVKLFWDWVEEAERPSRAWASSVVRIGRPTGSLEKILTQLQTSDPGRFRAADLKNEGMSGVDLMIADTARDVMTAMSGRVPFVITDQSLVEFTGPEHRWIGEPLARTVKNCASGYSAAELDRAKARWRDEFSPQAAARRIAELFEELER